MHSLRAEAQALKTTLDGALVRVVAPRISRVRRRSRSRQAESMLTNARTAPAVTLSVAHEVEALRELAADLAESGPFYAHNGFLACALCDVIGTAKSFKHDPSCLVARAQTLTAKPSEDALEVVEELGA
jgi:hypothetical protein